MRFVIVDRSLQDERGHHFALTNVITQGALQHGLDVVWLTHEQFPATLKMDGVTASGTFATSTYDYFKSLGAPTVSDSSHRWSRDLPGRIMRRLRLSAAARLPMPAWIRSSLQDPPTSDPAPKSLTDELLAGLDAHGIRNGDHILVHTTDGEMYRAVLALLMKTGSEEELPYFHLVTPYDSKTMPHYRRGLSIDRVIQYFQMLGFLGNKVFLHAENEALALDLSREWGVPVMTLEIPPPLEAARVTKRDNGPLTVVYLGAAREEKGFHLLPEVVGACEKSDSDIRFVIQCSPQIVGYTAAIKESIEKLEAFPGKFVKLIKSAQSMKNYYGVLRDAHVVLACYDAENYRVRGSGIAVEAIAFGNTVIATPGTTPELIADSAALAATGVEEITNAITKIANNKSDCAELALSRRQEYLQKNEGGAYISRILGAVNDVERSKAEHTDDGVRTKDDEQPAAEIAGDWRLILEEMVKGDGATESALKVPRLLGRE